MKVLLDECVNSRLSRLISGHVVETVTGRRWNGVKNGHLLSRAVDAGFQAFVTLDRNLPFQNHIASYRIAVFVLRARRNALPVLKPLVPALLVALGKATHGTVTVIG